MKLVDNLPEQKLLEEVLDQTKPPLVDIPNGMDYLLFTPFRYTASNPFCSRFRRPNSPWGVFYASASAETAITEMAFYRLLFYAESPQTPLPSNPAEYTAFAVQLCTEKGLDLSRGPLSENHSGWTDPQDYSACHKLADDARGEGIEVIAYPSVRDHHHRMNYAVLSPRAFASLKPITHQTWRMTIRKDVVIAKCESPKAGLSFQISDFDTDSRLKAAAQRVA